MGADDPAKAARKQANDTYKADKKACEAMKGKSGSSTAPSSDESRNAASSDKAAPATSGSSVK